MSIYYIKNEKSFKSSPTFTSRTVQINELLVNLYDVFISTILIVFEKTPHLHRQGGNHKSYVLFAKSQLMSKIKLLSLIVAVVGLEPTTFRL